MVGRFRIYVAASFALALGACETRSQVSTFDGRCWIRGPGETLTVLDAHVENIETCGARLEVRYLQTGAPVEGLFGGTEVFVNSKAIEAGTPWGHRARLLHQVDRERIDAAIRQLLERQASAATTQADKAAIL